ncbi:MAG: glycosyltransferase family 2 protein [Gammaproteobacteria bacterium]|nr:glycosyltransferase family 2 protein [Gammaproteobacteria bacterium]
MKISVCIPLYNGEHCIVSALRSLQSQTRIPDEVIIRDDCSTDGSKDLINTFNDLNIDYLTNEVNLGCVGNWNKCLEDSTGEIITFLHQDDGFEPTFLEQMETAFKEDPDNTGLWYCKTYVKENDITKDINKSQGSKSSFLETRVAVSNFFTWREVPAPTGVAFNKLALSEVGIYDPVYKICPEPDLYLRIVMSGYKVYKSSEILIWRTLPETRATNTFGSTKDYYNEWFYFLEKNSRNSELISPPLISDGLEYLYFQASRSVISNIYIRRFKESLKIVRMVPRKGGDFLKQQKLSQPGVSKFIVSLFLSFIMISYYNLRKWLATIYRSLRA